MNIVTVAVVGCGSLGSQMVEWMFKNVPWIHIGFAVEPNPARRQQIAKTGIMTFPRLDDVPNDVRPSIQVIIDCTKGASIQNKKVYQSWGLPAVFQNGEPNDVGELFFPPYSLHSKHSRYLRIAKCSAMSTLNVVRSILESHQFPPIIHIHGFHQKVNSHDRMLDMGYASGAEVYKLLGIPTRIDVVYLRGESHGYSYHGSVILDFEKSVDLKTFISTLSSSAHVKLVHQNIDTHSYERGVDTLIIKEGIYSFERSVRLNVLSFTPEINFPRILQAIEYLSRPGKKESPIP